MSETSVARKLETLTSLVAEEQVRKRFNEVLGDRGIIFLGSLLSLSNMSPQLKDVADRNPRSILQAGMIAATLDLLINPNLGFAFIIPYGEYAQFQMGAKGFIQLAIRTGLYKTMNTSEVYRDEIAKWDPLTGKFEATPWETWKLREKGDYRDVVGYMAYFQLHTGFEKTLYMTTEQITHHAKRYSKSYENPKGIWKTNPDAMAKKTVLKLLLSKYGPLSIQMQKAVEVDQAVVHPKDVLEGEISYDDRPADEPVATKPTGAEKKINNDQLKLLMARTDAAGINPEEVKDFIRTEFKLEHRHDLTIEQLTIVLKWLEKAKEAA